MAEELTPKDIRKLCGTTSYQRGEAYYKARRVNNLTYDPVEESYSATVKGSSYRVHVEYDSFGDYFGSVEPLG